MSIASMIGSVVGGVVKPVADLAGKNVERKKARDTINGQVALAKLDNQHSVNVGVHDWERLSKATEGSTWKDEYVTLSVFSLFNLLVVGSIASGMGFEWGGGVVDGVRLAIVELNAIDGLVGKLVLLTASAALSVKLANIFK